VKLKTFYSTQVKVRLHLWPTVAYYCSSESLPTAISNETFM